MMRTGIVCLLFMCQVCSAAVAATREDVQGIAYREQGLKVVEEKCLNCHNRQLIDPAIKSRRDM